MRQDGPQESVRVGGRRGFTVKPSELTDTMEPIILISSCALRVLRISLRVVLRASEGVPAACRRWSARMTLSAFRVGVRLGSVAVAHVRRVLTIYETYEL